MAAPARTRMEDSCILNDWESEDSENMDMKEQDVRLFVWFDLYIWVYMLQCD